ncbi:sigma-70 family RNA polymerase sigma factor [Chloroflexi bacterium TSY]|nr:sigma-70 family RNA polymerase sigma factor [Chloroflexi bacterium TSY]
MDQLVLLYQNLLYSIAYRMLHETDAAADAVQDSFIKAFRSLNSFRGGNFRAWLTRIVTNSCYDILRSRKRRLTDSLDELPVEAEYAQQLIDQSASPQSHAERNELYAFIEQGLHALSSEQRLMVILYDIHGYSYEEITEITDTTMGTVKSRLSRARAKLRDYLCQQPELLPAAFRPNE